MGFNSGFKGLNQIAAFVFNNFNLVFFMVVDYCLLDFYLFNVIVLYHQQLQLKYLCNLARN